MIQIICGIILVLIGIFVFWKFPIKSDTKSLTLAALFIVLAAILQRLSTVSYTHLTLLTNREVYYLRPGAYVINNIYTSYDTNDENGNKVTR